MMRLCDTVPTSVWNTLRTKTSTEFFASNVISFEVERKRYRQTAMANRAASMITLRASSETPRLIYSCIRLNHITPSLGSIYVCGLCRLLAVSMRRNLLPVSSLSHFHCLKFALERVFKIQQTKCFKRYFHRTVFLIQICAYEVFYLIIS